MAIRVALNHKTTYTYDKPVMLSPQVVRLRPAAHCRTPVPGYSIKISPAKHFLNWQQDPFGNYLARAVFPDNVKEFSVEVDLVAEMTTINPFDFFLEPGADHFPFSYDDTLAAELAPYLQIREDGFRLKEFVTGVRRAEMRTVDYLVEINQRVQKLVGYIIRLESGVQSAEETLKKKSGSCRDSAWLLVQTFRHLGLASRFVSGYLIQLKPDVKSLDGPSGTDKDFTDLHAWTEVYLPGAGWVGLDPTSGLFAGEGHIPLACTPDPSSAAPISGMVEECKTEFGFAMSVARVHEDPRVTMPYTEEQWQAIDRLGDEVDKKLKAGDVRLSMGGEPTFVSIDDMDGAEWNTAALGTRKTELGRELIERLQRAFAPGGLLHFGQGKWYPGESLPRWAFTCYWRKDGEPVWKNPELFGHEAMDYGCTEVHAQKFMDLLARLLSLDPAFAIPGFEDTWYYLWKERRLPMNVDPFKSKLKEEEERTRLAKVFEQGLAKIIGYTLPIARNLTGGSPAWITGPWFLRSDRMYLLPGDSPMGFRLPLDSQPWVAKGDFPHIHELDPNAPKHTLPTRAHFEHQHFLRSVALPVRPREIRAQMPSRGESAKWIVRTALCVEPRNGKLYVFMPPLESLEDYLDLVSAIEATAEQLKQPIIIEGYPPPDDDRVNKLKVTPDPGVIEVNIQPAGSWREMEHITTTLYEQARLCRLGTEKFMLDGRHTGTGGGNHVVLGGFTAADSPLLRRPDLLASIVAYWNNHPSLTYLFSGTFVGPTSQAPRVDEARTDATYELEIALQHLRECGPNPAPWRIDRALRNLLIDSTGNTHRAELCIDKLFSPDSSSGRMGLLELRGFEMPPHARMSLTQQLLIRSLIAMFWKQPYSKRLVRWGSLLHDKYLLPHFVADDFADVLGDLQDGGFPFSGDWFAPHFEFRFPRYGEVTYQNVNFELRQAIEPWNVLGEEPAGGATARYVDSSVERLQIKVRGLTDSRHVVLCNGRIVPLHPSGVAGESVAGIRYRAWQPPSCLHPTIGVHAPLVFDLYDTWSNRSIGGCTYHVSHPGGLNDSTFPVNALAAESRRIARFLPFGHSAGNFTPDLTARSNEFPFTMDLRRTV